VWFVNVRVKLKKEKKMDCQFAELVNDGNVIEKQLRGGRIMSKQIKLDDITLSLEAGNAYEEMVSRVLGGLKLAKKLKNQGAIITKEVVVVNDDGSLKIEITLQGTVTVKMKVPSWHWAYTH
jgi:hypothetical protein